MLSSDPASRPPRRLLRALIWSAVLLRVAATHTVWAQSAVIDVGSAIGRPGDAVDVAVSLTTSGGAALAATANDLIINKRVMTVAPGDCRINPSSGQTLTATVLRDSSGTRTLRLFVQSIYTNPPIHDGPLYICTVHIAPTTLPGSYPLTIRTAQGFGPTGVEVPRVTGNGGSVVVTLVLVPSPTPSPTRTPTPTPSPTPTLDPCPRNLTVDPSAGPPGSQVTLAGRCYFLHSGRSGSVYFDDAQVGTVAGDTNGNYSGVLAIPKDAAPGTHVIHILSPREIAAVPFQVTNCAGDCNGDGAITIDDLLQVVAIAFGDAPLTSCPSADTNGDGLVTIDEMLNVVQRALSGCGPPPG